MISIRANEYIFKQFCIFQSKYRQMIVESNFDGPSKSKSAALEHIFIFSGMRPPKGNSARWSGPLKNILSWFFFVKVFIKKDLLKDLFHF